MIVIVDLDKKENENYGDLKFKQFNFPSGCEPHICFDIQSFRLFLKDIETPLEDVNVVISCRMNDGNDIMRVLLATDALKRCNIYNIDLFIPYVPFARQDRVMNEGEPLSIKVFADIINSQDYNHVFVYDAHSDVTTALINNCIDITNHDFVKNVLRGKSDYHIISPDSGAYKKIFKLCEYIGYEGHISLCNKVRNIKNGNIEKIVCDVDDFLGKDVYIIDDICDGGATFVLLAEELKKRNCGKVVLVVTHGIFSKGITPLHNIDIIYTTNSFRDYKHEKVLQIDISLNSFNKITLE